jgi:hypothetical protein
MDRSPNANPKVIAAWVVPILVGLIVLTKPWLVEHLGITELSIHNRLVLMLALAVACTACIVVFRILNKPKPHA